MLSSPTTFILGAGASFELGFPLGDDLQKLVSQYVFVDTHGRFHNEAIKGALQHELHTLGSRWPDRHAQHASAARKITLGMRSAASIDNFLHTHQDDPDVVMIGKLAIVSAILEQERNCFLARPVEGSYHPFDDSTYVKSWYQPFIRMLTAGARSSDPASMLANARFVVFNYDRCLEICLTRAIADYHSISADEAAQIVKKLAIVHPYGTVGEFSLNDDDGIPFGSPVRNIRDLADGIRTFTESVAETTAAQTRKLVASSQTLVFMGFGFLQQNMELLCPGEDTLVNGIHATTLGFSGTDRSIIFEKLVNFIRPDSRQYMQPLEARRSGHEPFIDVNNSRCSDLIANHRMRLVA